MATAHTAAPGTAVQVVVYRWAGAWGPFKVRIPCGECALTRDVIADTLEHELAGVAVDLTVRDWLSEWWRPLARGGWHAPIVMVEGKVVSQRQAELTATRKRHDRTAVLVKRNALPQQQLDDDLASLQSAQAALAAANAQVLSAQASIEAAESQVIEAHSALEAAQASVERLQADIDDSQLRAPRSGRVQYRVAQPGEVLGAGGKVLNLVDLGDVYMTLFLPTEQAGRVALGAEARLVLDAIPGYVNYTWFNIKEPGVYKGQCAELCGRNHANMVAQVRALPPAKFRTWASVT